MAAPFSAAADADCPPARKRVSELDNGPCDVALERWTASAVSYSDLLIPSSSATIASERPTASNAPSASAFPIPAPTGDDGDFVRSAVFDVAAGPSSTHITAWNGGFVAVGPSLNFWTSSDGEAWETLAPTGLEQSILVNLVAIPDGRLLAFGYVSGPSLSGEPQTWISADARSWEAIDLGLPTEVGVTGAAAGPRGVVLIIARRQLWFSADGLSWRLTHEGSGEQAFEAIGAGPEGFVAVGQQGWMSRQYRSVVVASSDGVNWIEAPADGGVLNTTPSLWAVSPIGGDWLAAPIDRRRPSHLLRSANGLEWSSAASFSLGSDQDGQIPLLGSNGKTSFLRVPTGDDPNWHRVGLERWSPLGCPSRQCTGQGAFDVASYGATTVLPHRLAA